MYARHARDLCRASSLDEKLKTLRDLGNKVEKALPTEEEFLAGFRALRYSATFPKERRLVHYVLSGMAQFNYVGTVIDCKAMTIEHIAPQSISVDEEMLANIGNLILVDDATNNRLGAKSFDQKQMVLKGANVPMKEAILDAKKWDNDEIVARATEMARQAYQKIWGL